MTSSASSLPLARTRACSFVVPALAMSLVVAGCRSGSGSTDADSTCPDFLACA